MNAKLFHIHGLWHKRAVGMASSKGEVVSCDKDCATSDFAKAFVLWSADSVAKCSTFLACLGRCYLE